MSVHSLQDNIFKKVDPISLIHKYSKVKNPKSRSSLKAPEDLEGLKSQKNLILQNAQIKV